MSLEFFLESMPTEFDGKWKWNFELWYSIFSIFQKKKKKKKKKKK